MCGAMVVSYYAAWYSSFDRVVGVLCGVVCDGSVILCCIV